MTTNNNALVSSLIDLLDNGDEVDKCHAAQALGRIRDSSACVSLAARLRDRDIDVCVDAATALGAIKNPDFASALIDSAQHDGSAEIRVAAIEALGYLGGQEVADILIGVVESRPGDLGMLEDDDWDPWWDMQLKAIQALGRIGSESAVPVLVRLLESDDADDIENELFNALAMIGGAGEHYLVDRLSTATVRQRRRIASALPLCDTPNAWKALLGGVKGQDTDVRVAVLKSLQGYHGAQEFERLMLVLGRDRDRDVRSAAAGLLVGFDRDTTNADRAGAEEINAQLIRMLTDPEAGVRQAVLDGLGKHGAAEMDPALRAAVCDRFDDSDQAVAAAACRLAGHCPEVPEALLGGLVLDTAKGVGVRTAAIHALASRHCIDAETVEILHGAAFDQAEPIRLAALSALVQLDAGVRSSSSENSGNARPLDLVRRIVESVPVVKADDRDNDRAEPGQNSSGQNKFEEDESGENIAEQGGVDAGGDAVQGNQAGAETKSPDVTEIGNESDDSGPRSTLDSILRDNARIKSDSGQAGDNRTGDYDPLRQAGELSSDMHEYADYVRKTVKEREAWLARDKVLVSCDVRYLATRLLGESDDDSVVDTLLQTLADDDSELRRDAAGSLARIAERRPDLPSLKNAWGALVTHLKTDDQSVRLSCVRALGALGHRKSMNIIAEALDDTAPSVRSGAIGALAKIAAACPPNHPKRVSAVRLMQARLDDPDKSVQRTAAMVLLDLGDDHARLAGLDSLVCAENSLGPVVRGKLHALRTESTFQQQLVEILSRCANSSERQPVLECIGEIFQTPGQASEQAR